MTTSMPVSYTHLDVYKRQVIAGPGEVQLLQLLPPGLRAGEVIGAARRAIRVVEIGFAGFRVDNPVSYTHLLHGILISRIRSFDACLTSVDEFLPHVANWATCDMLSPSALARQPQRLLEAGDRWLHSGEPYTVRFGIGRLMAHFLDEQFSPAYPEMVAAVQSDKYYVNMMRAWYFAPALAKQYEAVLPYFAEQRLDVYKRQPPSTPTIRPTNRTI